LVLTGQLANELQPDTVVPFTVDHQQATALLQRWVGKRRYVPKDFYSPERVDQLTGLYFPLYCVDATLDAEVEGSSVRGDDNPPSEMVAAAGQVQIENLPIDALRDSPVQPLMDVLQPWDLRQAVPFAPHYLSGFSTERRDLEFTDVEAYAARSLDLTSQRVLATEMFRTHKAVQKARPLTQLQLWGQSQLRAWRHRYTLVPAWLIFYSAPGGKQYSFGINGQTGETHGTLPYDRRKLDRETWGILALVAALPVLGIVVSLLEALIGGEAATAAMALVELPVMIPLLLIAWGAGAFIRGVVRYRYNLPFQADRRDQAVGHTVVMTRNESHPGNAKAFPPMVQRWQARGRTLPIIFLPPPADQPDGLAEDFESLQAVPPSMSSYNHLLEVKIVPR
jgi:hypothetical protein